MAKDEWWELPCKDASGRQRAMLYGLRSDEIVLTVPPGESAVLDWQTAAELARLLRGGSTTLLGRAGEPA